MSMNVEEESQELPVYTMQWLWKQIAWIIAMAVIFSLVGSAIGSVARERFWAELLTSRTWNMISGALTYRFAVITLTLATLMMIEVAYRKRINLLQYGLVAAALCLFFFMLLALAEIISFKAAYVVVSIMITGMIGIFVKAMTRSIKAAITAGAVLAAEYVAVLMLVSMGSMALLVGSLILFALIAVAMYFTVKLQIKDGELTLGR